MKVTSASFLGGLNCLTKKGGGKGTDEVGCKNSTYLLSCDVYLN